MTRQEKDQFIDQLATKLDASKNLYLTDISGLTVDASNKLRRLCFNKGVQLEVVKNSLLKQAMEKVETNYEEAYDLLVGNTALMYSESGNLPAKVIKEFRKNSEKPILKGAYVETSFYLGDEQVKELSTLKSKDELIGEIIALLQSPAKNVISALQSGGNNLSGILKTLGDRPDVSDEAPAKSEDAVAEPASDVPAAEETKEEASEASAEAASEESTESSTEEAKEEVTKESADAGETTEATVEATEEASAEESTEESSNDESNDETPEANAEEETKEEETTEEESAEEDDESTEASTEAKEDSSSDSDESSDESTEAKAAEEDPSAEDEEKKD